jgi:adenosylmethionine---8-amino-7-oxononanoate aminotransferase
MIKPYAAAMQTSPLQIWHPFTQQGSDAPPLHVRSASGVYIETEDGRRIIDAISSWWVNLHGHAHPAIADAIARQTRVLEHVIFAGFTHEPAEELVARLRLIVPPGLAHIFFSDDGSTAVEVALKLAVQYWNNLGSPEKNRIVALEHAYHGDTVGAMSVSDDSPFTAAFDSLRVPVLRTHSAYCHRCPVGKTRATCSIECLDRLRQLLEAESETIAAIIVEPLLQAAGGMIVHPEEFLTGVRDLATRHNVLLIADEVLTGFGRTGKMFACERAGISPDLMCVSKGITGGFLPLAATIATEEIAQAFRGGPRERAFFHGHSYTGNPIACAAANANLEIFATEPVFERIAAIERIHADRLAQLRERPGVGDVRHIGDVGALELNVPDPGYLSGLRPKLYEFYLRKGVLLRPLGNVVYVLPPYVITPAELNFVYDVIEESLEMIAAGN